MLGSAPRRRHSRAGGGAVHSIKSGLRAFAVFAVQLLTIDVIVGQNAQCGAVEVIVLVRAQRPHESEKSGQAEQKRHRHEVNQHIHCTYSIRSRAAAVSFQTRSCGTSSATQALARAVRSTACVSKDPVSWTK